MEPDPSPEDQSFTMGSSENQFLNSVDIAAATDAAIAYLSSRSSAIASNTFLEISKWIHPESRQLIEFENERFNNLATLGEPSAWNGIIEHIWSEATVLDCTETEGEVDLEIRDWTGIQWRPAPVMVHRTPEQEALVQRFPEKYGLNIPDFELTTSGFGTHHYLTMGKSSRGWKVIQDGYRESIVALGGPSPDFVTDLHSPVWVAKHPSKDPTKPESKTAAKILGRTFDWAAAAAYAAEYAHARNNSYIDFWPNDCANFVSQCLTAGGYPADETWAPYTTAWINNSALRDWLLNSGRGLATDEGALGLADIINCDWLPGATHDGVAIVTGLPGPLVSCHTTDHQNVPYKAISHSAPNYLYTTTLVSY